MLNLSFGQFPSIKPNVQNFQAFNQESQVVAMVGIHFDSKEFNGGNAAKFTLPSKQAQLVYQFVSDKEEVVFDKLLSENLQKMANFYSMLKDGGAISYQPLKIQPQKRQYKLFIGENLVGYLAIDFTKKQFEFFTDGENLYLEPSFLFADETLIFSIAELNTYKARFEQLFIEKFAPFADFLQQYSVAE